MQPLASFFSLSTLLPISPLKPIRTAYLFRDSVTLTPVPSCVYSLVMLRV